jgi:hypothetical protein
MAVTTLDAALQGMMLPSAFYKAQVGTPVVGTMYSQWVAPGSPGAATTLPTGLLAGQFFTCAAAQVAGQLKFSAGISGDTFYLARFTGASNTTGTLILADRIWGDSVSGVPVGTQTIYSGSFPRSAGIGGGDSSGTGVQLAIEVYASIGATACTPKVTYVNSAGTAGDTGTAAYAVPSSAVAGTFIPINLKAGAFGVRSVTAYNNMTARTQGGAFGVVAYRPLAYVPCNVAGVAGVVDFLTSGFPIMFPNTIPFLIWMAGTATVPVIAGSFYWCCG